MVQRYNLQPSHSGLGIIVNDEGNGCLFTDYEKLEQESARLREALERCNELLVVAQLTASKALQAQP